MQVHEIMSSPVVGLLSDATLEEAARVMLERGYTTLPVFDERGKLIGLVTETDLGITRFVHDREQAGTGDESMVSLLARRVRPTMRSPVFVRPDAELAELAAIMVKTHLRCVPVAEGGKVVGIVSWRDVLTRLSSLPASEPSYERS